MRLKTKILLVAIPTAAIVATGTVIAVGLHIHRLHRKKAAAFLPDEVRNALEDLCRLKAEDYAPDKLGTSLYQRKLNTLTDRQLIGVYLLIKTAEVLHSRGVNIHHLTKDDVRTEVTRLRDAAHDRHDRRALLARLGSIGAETARGVLSDGLLLAGMAA